MKQESSTEETEDNQRPGFLAAMMSVFAAAFGVQNSKTRKRDFTSGNPVTFIIAGLVFTVLFVVTLIMIVSLVLS